MKLQLRLITYQKNKKEIMPESKTKYLNYMIYFKKNLYFLIGLIIFFSCGENSESIEKRETQKQNNLVELTVQQLQNANISYCNIKQQAVSGIIKVTGKIDVPPQNLVSISAPFGGYLKSTKLLPGMHVSKGEVIATLEDQQYIQLQEDFLNTKSKLTFAETEYLRQKELNENKASSDKIFLAAKKEYESLKISLAALTEKLSMININVNELNENRISKNISLYAPFNGFVSKVNVNIGKYLNPSDVLFELVNPEDIHLNLIVFEKDLTQLEVGQKVVAYTNTHPEKKYNCEILLVSKDIAMDRSAEVHCHFEQYNKILLPGMYMNAEISGVSRLAYVLPENAIVYFEGKQYVFLLEGKNKFLMQEVQTGIKENSSVEIINSSALSGKGIVLNGAYTLLMVLKNKAGE